MNVVNVSRIISRAIGKPTKLIRVLKDSTNHVSAAQKCGVKIGCLIYRCEPSKEQPHVIQCFSVRNLDNTPMSVKTSSVACHAQASAK